MLTIGTPSYHQANDIEGQSKKKQKRGHLETDEANVITVDDHSGPMGLMFALLDDKRDPEVNLKDYKVCDWMDLKGIADKYNVLNVSRLLAERLWVEASNDDGYDPFWIYATAMHLGHKSLARYACSRVKYSFAPSGLYWWTVQCMGLEAYYTLAYAEKTAKPFSWMTLSQKLVFVSQREHTIRWSER